MAVIDYIIGPTNYELVRDRIGGILANELANQFTLSSDNDLKGIQVFNSRFITVDKNECINGAVINVCMFRNDFGPYDQEQMLGHIKYVIDVYCAAKSTTTGIRGDSTAQQKLDKILGKCILILKDARYNTLAFPVPSIQTTYVESIEKAVPGNTDADNIMMGRLTFCVKVNETVQLKGTNLINGWDTQWQLDLTNEGYIYIVNETI